MIYTTGYYGRNPLDLLRIAERLDAVVVDIRLKPFSRDARWNKAKVAGVLGARYIHCKSFGNVNYKGGPVMIEDFDAGRNLIESYAGRNLILLCVCKHAEKCHRTDIAARLVELGYEVSELDWDEGSPDDTEPGFSQLVLLPV